jgi:hypothetical protein
MQVIGRFPISEKHETIYMTIFVLVQKVMIYITVLRGTLRHTVPVLYMCLLCVNIMVFLFNRHDIKCLTIL